MPDITPEDQEEANRKLLILMKRGASIAKELQEEGFDLDQTLTIIFSAAGASVGASRNPQPLDGSILEAARVCYRLGAQTQGVEL